VGLDYVARYEAAEGRRTFAEKMVDVREHTGISGFHLVDEAAPAGVDDAPWPSPSSPEAAPLTWWGNIRFERAFTPDLCRLLAAAGLVGVTGGPRGRLGPAPPASSTKASPSTRSPAPARPSGTLESSSTPT
jgi:hypothetical protein